MNIRLAFSTCPNDTFMFYALVFQKIKTPGFTFEVQLADIHELNQLAVAGEADMIKVSSNALGLLHPDYFLLSSGSAMGRGCGPLLIRPKDAESQAWQNGTVAIPGRMTTANLLLSFLAPEQTKRKEMLFSEILDEVSTRHVDGGLLIHEQRFTYQNAEVDLVQDLGEYWEQKTGLPIPLGAIVVSRKLGAEKAFALQELLKQSIQWAFDHPEETMPYVREHAKEMEDGVMRAHIDLYVNDFSLDFGSEGEKALNVLLDTGVNAGLYPVVPAVSAIMCHQNTKA